MTHPKLAPGLERAIEIVQRLLVTPESSQIRVELLQRFRLEIREEEHKEKREASL